jgi:hypothetical protein
MEEEAQLDPTAVTNPTLALIDEGQWVVQIRQQCVYSPGIYLHY